MNDFTRTHEVGDGTLITLTPEQNTEYLKLRRDYQAMRKDHTALLYNLKKYGAFNPTPEQFAAYRAARDQVESAASADERTGLEGKSLGDLIAALNSWVQTSDARLVIKELGRRVAMETARVQVTNNALKAAQDAHAEALRGVSIMQEQMQNLAQTVADMKEAERDMQHRIEYLRGQLPEVHTESGRAIEL